MMQKLKMLTLSTVLLMVFSTCKNRDSNGSTDTNNTTGSKDVTDSTRKIMKSDSTHSVDTSRQAH